MQVFDGLNSMQRCEELLGKLKAKTSGFMETRGGRDVLLTEDDFAELVQ